MKKPPLSNQSRAAVRASHPTPGTPPARAQLRFDKLLQRLREQRDDIARWRAFRLAYDEQLAVRYAPLAARLREKRIAMAKLLDRAIEGDALTRRQRGDASAVLAQLLTDLLSETEDAEVVGLHDKYADVSFAEEQRGRMQALRTLARENLDVDIDAYDGGESPEEFTEWVQDRVHAARGGGSADAPAAAPVRKGAHVAVREVFRKLVSELHPDRETDPQEHARKTELMQRVNKAYKAGDLYTLLELQWSVAALDPASLAGLAKERLRHYTRALEAQSRRLKDELEGLVAPFALAVGGGGKPRKVTTDAVQRALDADIREIKRVLKDLEMDMVRFRTLRR